MVIKKKALSRRRPRAYYAKEEDTPGSRRRGPTALVFDGTRDHSCFCERKREEEEEEEEEEEDKEEEQP